MPGTLADDGAASTRAVRWLYNMSAITLAPTTNPAIALLANVLFNAFDATKITTQKSWGFSPDALDFSSVGDISIAIDGPSATVTFTFRNGYPVLAATLDLTKLEAALSGAPNNFDTENSGDLTPATVLRYDLPNVTRQKSGIMFLTGHMSGTQTTQDDVILEIWRDFGSGAFGSPGPNAVKIVTNGLPAPGGVGGYPWGGHAHEGDTLPDGSAHTYSLFAYTADRGSTLSCLAGFARWNVFELGAPG